MKTQGEDVHLQAKERGLRRNQLCQRHLDLRTSNLQNGEKTHSCCLNHGFQLFKYQFAVLGDGVMVALANYRALVWPIVDNNTSIYNIPGPCAQ